jgi:hypothetical protein
MVLLSRLQHSQPATTFILRDDVPGSRVTKL